MGYISHIVYHVMNYHSAKFGAFTIKSTILVKFCTNLLDYITNFYFQAQSCVCACKINLHQRQASARSLSRSTFLPCKIDCINSIRRAEIIHIPNRLSTSGLIAATNSHLTPTKNRLEARHHDITRTQTVSVVKCCEQNGCSQSHLVTITQPNFWCGAPFLGSIC